jgi:small ligand-binding sensory domain FIST
MSHAFAVAAHWSGEFDEPALQKWVEKLRAQLTAPKVSLGLIFIAPKFFPFAAQILELARVHARVPLLAGCSSQGLIADGEEIESDAGLSLGLYYFPNTELHAFRFTQEHIDEANGPAYWHVETGLDPTQVNGWLAFCIPFNLDCDTWLRLWNEAYAPLPILGGLASGDFNAQQTQVYLNGEVFEDGLVVIGLCGDVTVSSVISQGCTPIGETWTITRAEKNIIREIGNRPAYTVLAETISRLSPEEQRKSQGNLFIGLVVNEYLEEFKRGDFLIRNLLGADPASGVLAVAAFPRAGQTLQFQRRDAAAANADMIEILTHAREKLAGTPLYGACLFTCNGRGSNLFGYPNHDAGLIQKRLGPLALTGFFCNGEIGPVGDKNFLHGWTASLALFVPKEAA